MIKMCWQRMRKEYSRRRDADSSRKIYFHTEIRRKNQKVSGNHRPPSPKQIQCLFGRSVRIEMKRRGRTQLSNPDRYAERVCVAQRRRDKDQQLERAQKTKKDGREGGKGNLYWSWERFRDKSETKIQKEMSENFWQFLSNPTEHLQYAYHLQIAIKPISVKNR